MGLNTALELFLKLGEASGTRADSSGNGRDFTDNNTVTSNPGKVGDAAQFTAANSEYLSRADEAGLSFGNEDFSISCWIYLDTTGVAHTIIAKGTGEWRVDITSGNRVRFVLPSSSLTSTAVTLSASTWYHVVATYDSVADLMAITINNGTAQTASNTTGATDSTSAVWVGRISTVYMNGRIDALGIWRRVLTADEIAQLYNSGNGAEPPFAENYTRTLTESLGLTDSTVRGIGLTLTEAITATDGGAQRAHARSLVEALAVSDAATAAIARSFLEQATLSDEAVRAAARTLSESVGLSDALTLQIALQVSEALALSEAASFAVARSCVEALTLSDGATRSVTRTLSETLGVSDSIATSILKVLVAYVGASPLVGRLAASERRTIIETSRNKGGS